MKLKISFPVTSSQKLIEVDDECKLHTCSEKGMETQVDADTLVKSGKNVWSRSANKVSP
ncbi:40s ribosomal protein s6-like [Lynx pardinus]|uniref:40s ribosomal protein s6-like n=1 Tax=Lynx pardinus TaxID=191816 RepID=A0A485PL81_LYNPA|nr:40s ribosomal protein s6-like [Lynx pardinus]